MHRRICSPHLDPVPPGPPSSPRIDPLEPCTESERSAVIARLQRATRTGAIELDEFEARLDQALGSSTYLELQRSISDLPGEVEVTGRRRVSPPIATYLGVIALLVLVWLVTSPGGYFWPIWPALGWGIPVLIRHRRCGTESASAAF